MDISPEFARQLILRGDYQSFFFRFRLKFFHLLFCEKQLSFSGGFMIGISPFSIRGNIHPFDEHFIFLKMTIRFL
jgi:hypothetical protein